MTKTHSRTKLHCYRVSPGEIDDQEIYILLIQFIIKMDPHKHVSTRGNSILSFLKDRIVCKTILFLENLRIYCATWLIIKVLPTDHSKTYHYKWKINCNILNSSLFLCSFLALWSVFQIYVSVLYCFLHCVYRNLGQWFLIRR